MAEKKKADGDAAVVVGESHPEPVRVGPLLKEHTHRGILFPVGTHIDDVEPYQVELLKEWGVIEK